MNGIEMRLPRPLGASVGRRGGDAVHRPALVLSLVAIALVACGRPPPPPKTTAAARPAPAPPKAVEDENDGLAVSGLLGTLDEDAIQRGISTRLPRAAACFQRWARRRPYLAGTLSLEFRVAANGQTKRLRILESTLGAWDVERCVHEELRACVFPRPRGGEAEFTYPLSFDGRIRAQVWDPGMIGDELDEKRDELLGIRKKRSRKARRGGDDVELVPPAGLTLTFYIDRRGRVVSVGLVAEEPIDEDFAKRFIANLQQLRFQVATEGRYAKVVYRW